MLLLPCTKIKWVSHHLQVRQCSGVFHVSGSLTYGKRPVSHCPNLKSTWVALGCGACLPCARFPRLKALKQSNEPNQKWLPVLKAHGVNFYLGILWWTSFDLNTGFLFRDHFVRGSQSKLMTRYFTPHLPECGNRVLELNSCELIDLFSFQTLACFARVHYDCSPGPTSLNCL